MKKSLLIRAEDKNQWERRTPLIPRDAAQIRQGGETRVLAETSAKRCFSDSDYLDAGVEICQGMDAGDVILGVKEIPNEKLLPGKVYLFFSHTVKGQAQNMAMLKRIMDLQATLIDYERICDRGGRRLIFFGPLAGSAGAIDIFHLLGQYWDHHGLETPFLECRQALDYSSLEEAKGHFQVVGKAISEGAVPAPLSPLVVGVLGYGQVSQGAQAVLESFPLERLEPTELPTLTSRGKVRRDCIYLSVFKEEDLVRPLGNRSFVLEDYYQHPEHYESKFADYLPFITVLVNGIYWDNRYPRFVTWSDLKRLADSRGPSRLAGIADITCDVGGSIECNVKATDSGAPAYLCDPIEQNVVDGHRGDGILMLAVDNLPAELPLDSSDFFSTRLRDFVPSLLEADYFEPLNKSGLPPELRNAVIVYNGELTPEYRYLEEHL
jgi:alpha-aminoadipic semialdehyde synthase